MPAAATPREGRIAGADVGAPPGVSPVPANETPAPAPSAGRRGLRPIIVQIDNAVPARPPLHLSEADVVYEYVAEGGVTRFSALFTKEDVGAVGPLRSARLISLEIARQFEALLAYHGASTGVQQRIWNGGIYFVSFAAGDAASLEARIRTRPAPHNATTSLPQVRSYAAARGVPPIVDSWPDFPRGDRRASSTGIPTPSFSVGYAYPNAQPWREYRADFAYVPDEKRYVRAHGGVPHIDGATGRPIAAETVVVQIAPVVVTDIVEDALGSLSLDYQLQGQGDAVFHREGLRWEGRWERRGAFQPTRYFGPDGQPFEFGAGPIWIAVVEPSTQLSWGTAASGRVSSG